MSKKVKAEYAYGFDGEFSNNDFSDSREGALEAARQENTDFWLGGKKTVQIGKVVHLVPSIDGIQTLEMLGNEMYDEVGDYALDYLMDVPEDATKELERKLNEVLYAWMKKHNQLPTFFNVVDVKTVGL